MLLKDRRLVQSVVICLPEDISRSLPHLGDNSDKHILKPPPFTNLLNEQPGFIRVYRNCISMLT